MSGIIDTEEKAQIQDAIRDFDKEIKDLDLALSNSRDSSAAAEAATLKTDQSLWWMLAAAGFAVLLVEWWWFQRRPSCFRWR